MGFYIGVNVKLQESVLVGHLELAILRRILEVYVGGYLIRQFLRYYSGNHWHLTLYSVVDREKLRIVKFDIV